MWSPNTARYGAFFRGMLARGVYPPPSQFEAWFLSGPHTKGDVEKTIKAARDAMLGLIDVASDDLEGINRDLYGYSFAPPRRRAE